MTLLSTSLIWRILSACFRVPPGDAEAEITQVGAEAQGADSQGENEERQVDRFPETPGKSQIKAHNRKRL